MATITNPTIPQVYTPRDLLNSLPLIKEVKKSKGHIFYQSYGCDRVPLVGLNGDIQRMIPVLGGSLEVEDFDRYMFLPLTILRHALENWPKGELVTVTRGVEDIMRFSSGASGGFEKIGEKRYIELAGGNYRLKLNGVSSNICFREHKGTGKRPFERTWFTISKERLLKRRELEKEKEERQRKWEEEGKYPWWRKMAVIDRTTSG